jgi:glutamate dehydrogenase
MEAEVARLARTWDDLLRDALMNRFGHARGHALALRWLAAFTPHYKSTTAVELAVRDIEQIERLLDNGRFSVLIGSTAAA